MNQPPDEQDDGSLLGDAERAPCRRALGRCSGNCLLERRHVRSVDPRLLGLICTSGLYRRQLVPTPTTMAPANPIMPMSG